MYYDREEYEKLIDESILFSLDKEKQSIAYRKEEMKMVEYIYCYLMGTKKKEEYEPYGLEIVETAKRCIRNYDSSKGRFLNFFSATWKGYYSHIVGNKIIEEKFKGIHFTDEEKLNYKNYLRFAQKKGMDVDSNEFILKFMEITGLDEEKVKTIREMINSQTLYDSIINDGDEEFSLLEQIDNGEYSDKNLLQITDAKVFLDSIELAFENVQKRQKAILSSIITSKIVFLVCDNQDLIEWLNKKSFFDEQIYKETISRGELILVKEIAQRYEVNEASISRTWKVFKEKLQKFV